MTKQWQKESETWKARGSFESYLSSGLRFGVKFIIRTRLGVKGQESNMLLEFRSKVNPASALHLLDCRYSDCKCSVDLKYLLIGGCTVVVGTPVCTPPVSPCVFVQLWEAEGPLGPQDWVRPCHTCSGAAESAAPAAPAQLISLFFCVKNCMCLYT